MRDLIERQAAIDAIANCTNCGDEKTLRAYVQKHNLDNGWTGGILEAIDAIEDLSSAQPEPQWIPCSEMEPKKSGRYLCTHSGTGIVSPDYYTTQEQAEELFADPEDEYLDLEEYIGWTSKNVIAWMPLPEPYRTERRTDGEN